MYIVVVVGSVSSAAHRRHREVALGPATGTSARRWQLRQRRHVADSGTVVLVGVFFVSFVLYYFVNWKYLAELWPLK